MRKKYIYFIGLIVVTLFSGIVFLYKNKTEEVSLFLKKYESSEIKPLWLPFVRVDEAAYKEENGKYKKSYDFRPIASKVKINELADRNLDLKIIDGHEHVYNMKEAERLLIYMNKYTIDKSILVGTSKYTFTLDNKYGFEEFKENNERILEVSKKYPKRFIAFPTLRPADDNNVELVKKYVREGAQGIKLYLGHGGSTGKEPFHLMPLNDSRMFPLYEWAEKVQLPIIMHVNLTKYYDEFVDVMERYPQLRICVPHLGLFKNNERRLSRLGWLLSRYPNMFTDFGFGWFEYQVNGFERFSENPFLFTQFFIKYSKKIMFSTDMVLESTKDNDYIDYTIRSYRQVVEMPYFRLFLRPKFAMQGLNLKDDVLKDIYENSAKQFLLINETGLLPDRVSDFGFKYAQTEVLSRSKKIKPLPQNSLMRLTPNI